MIPALVALVPLLAAIVLGFVRDRAIGGWITVAASTLAFCNSVTTVSMVASPVSTSPFRRVKLLVVCSV